MKAAIDQVSQEEDQAVAVQGLEWIQAIQQAKGLRVEYRISEEDLDRMGNWKKEIENLVATACDLVVTAGAAITITVPEKAKSGLRLKRFAGENIKVELEGRTLKVGPQLSQGDFKKSPSLIIASVAEPGVPTLLADKTQGGEELYGQAEEGTASSLLIAALAHATSPDLTKGLLVWELNGQWGRVSDQNALGTMAGFVQRTLNAFRAQMRIEQAA